MGGPWEVWGSMQASRAHGASHGQSPFPRARPRQPRTFMSKSVDVDVASTPRKRLGAGTVRVSAPCLRATRGARPRSGRPGAPHRRSSGWDCMSTTNTPCAVVCASSVHMRQQKATCGLCGQSGQVWGKWMVAHRQGALPTTVKCSMSASLVRQISGRANGRGTLLYICTKTCHMV
eukprot:101406-Chlamydomonas_euryale.AAC.5